MDRNALLAYLDATLTPASFKDYCPNGLQVEGRAQIERILCGVTASQALLDQAVAEGVDAVLVHHGYFWRNENAAITGLRKKRLQTLLSNDINLIAYHLPLDAHPQLGNNAQLALRMGWEVSGYFGEQNLGCIGKPTQRIENVGSLTQQLMQLLAHKPMVIGDLNGPVERIAWCSGGAQSYFEDAIDAGAQVFVSGEISESTVHLARESGTAYIAAGHHATERYGICALAEQLQAACGVQAWFVDLYNPV